MSEERTDLAHLRALAEGATPGPWRAVTSPGVGAVDAPEAGCYVYLNVRHEESDDTVRRWQRDARYIAAISPDVLLALLDRLERVEEAAREVVEMSAPGLTTLRDVALDALRAALRGEP